MLKINCIHILELKRPLCKYSRMAEAPLPTRHFSIQSEPRQRVIWSDEKWLFYNNHQMSRQADTRALKTSMKLSNGRGPWR